MLGHAGRRARHPAGLLGWTMRGGPTRPRGGSIPITGGVCVSRPETGLESISARTRAAYDRIAPAYVERNGGPPPPRLIASLDRFAATLPPGVRVLDLGCGPGLHT